MIKKLSTAPEMVYHLGMEIKAAFFDIDGTLLAHPEKTIPESSLRSLRKLREKGILVIASTGRHISEMRRLPLDGIVFDYMVTLNGQLVLDRTGKTIISHPLPEEAKPKIRYYFENRIYPLMIVEEDRIYINFNNLDVEVCHKAISTPLPDVGRYTGSDVYQLISYGKREDMLALEKSIPGVKAVWWNSYGIDLIPVKGGKEKGISALLERLGISKDETISFGDGENDIGMLGCTGIGVAMGNASSAAKAAAGYVTKDIRDDGIEHALTHFGIID